MEPEFVILSMKVKENPGTRLHEKVPGSIPRVACQVWIIHRDSGSTRRNSLLPTVIPDYEVTEKPIDGKDKQDSNAHFGKDEWENETGGEGDTTRHTFRNVRPPSGKAEERPQTAPDRGHDE